LRSASQDSTPHDHTSVRTERPQVSAALHRSPRIIDGNVAGTTEVVVADANKGPGVNKEGIPVIFVNGPGVTGDEVLLEEADRYRLLQLRPVL